MAIEELAHRLGRVEVLLQSREHGRGVLDPLLGVESERWVEDPALPLRGLRPLPLVGREPELAALLKALRTGGTVRLVGEAGIGKSRLLDELPGGRRRADAGELVAGTLDAFLAQRLTGEDEVQPVTESGAPRGRKHLLLMNPPVLDQALAKQGEIDAFLTQGVGEGHSVADSLSGLRRLTEVT